MTGAPHTNGWSAGGASGEDVGTGVVAMAAEKSRNEADDFTTDEDSDDGKFEAEV